MSKRGLGKGLGALITEVGAAERSSVQEIEIDKIEANPDQPRRHFDDEKLQELAASIKQHGVVQPILLRQRGKRYEIVAGERRWRAAQLAGLERVPAIVREFDEAQLMEVALIENIQREDLNPIEEAEAYRRLIEQHGLTQEELAKRLGKSRPQISNTLRLLNLDPQVRAKVAGGEISMGHAKVLLGSASPAIQRQVAEWVVSEGLTVREVEQVLAEGDGAPTQAHLQRVRRAKGQPGAKEGPRSARRTRRDPELLAVEDQLRQALGTPVQISSGGNKGKIVINFFGEEDLTRLVDLLTGRSAPSVELKRGPRQPFRV